MAIGRLELIENVEMSEISKPYTLLACIRSQRYSMHELRMQLQSLPKAERFGALLLAFTEVAEAQNIQADQEIAGRLLIALRPICPEALPVVLQKIAPSWNPSVEQLPQYLAAVFGADEVRDTALAIAATYAKESREAKAMGTIAWWLGHVN